MGRRWIFIPAALFTTWKSSRKRAYPRRPPGRICGIRRLAGRVAIPTLNTTMGQCFLAAAEHLAGGDESTPDKGIAKIAEIKAQSFPGSSSTITTLLTSASAWAIPWLNGRSWALIDQGLPFAYVLPKEGGYRGMTKIDVVAGSKHREEALAYINEVLGPLSQLGMVYEFPYGPTNKLLAPILAAYPEISKKFPASPEDLNRLRPSTGQCSTRCFQGRSTCGTGKSRPDSAPQPTHTR